MYSLVQGGTLATAYSKQILENDLDLEIAKKKLEIAVKNFENTLMLKN